MTAPAPRPVRPFLAGFRAILPLWLGVAPFAAAYAVTARAAGLSVWETQWMSLSVFAGSSQLAAAGLFGQAAAPLGIIATTAVLNVRHVLYGLSLAQRLPLGWPQRLLAAQFLTDEAYGVALNAPALSFGYLLGAELSLYAVWNLFTLLGALLGSLVPDPQALGVGIIFPLAYLGLLIPQLRAMGSDGRVAAAVVLISALLAWMLPKLLPGGLVVLLTGVLGALAGAWLSTRWVARP
ncbi:branched-chain amino acid permease [Deinococcus irradiatisoli]|uniref:Branched-chain amino acid permease n=1 Tax=Deinococcus irradiatisoli TaxID=2202254 RepID=A0A2Z3JBL4_9DEIO|nr:AzlC family ABC transporter permease [Deinococcus irradiatisoli]AWN22422.1 branched-chain amino acid permease [Deinococcus irradiatisoli]